MPVFTFEKISPEKISPPARRGPAIEKKPRRVIFQILDRMAEAGAKRRLRGDKASREQTPRD